jgi:hypothetical protein
MALLGMVMAWVMGTPGSLVKGRPGVTALHCSGEDKEWVSEAHRPVKEGAVGNYLEGEVTRKVAVGKRPWSALCLLLICNWIGTKSSRPPC